MGTQNAISNLDAAVAVQQRQAERLPNRAAAAYLGITEHTLDVWRCTKRYPIPYIKVGSRIFYLKADLDRWLESRLAGVEG